MSQSHRFLTNNWDILQRFNVVNFMYWNIQTHSRENVQNHVLNCIIFCLLALESFYKLYALTSNYFWILKVCCIFPWYLYKRMSKLPLSWTLLDLKYLDLRILRKETIFTCPGVAKRRSHWGQMGQKSRKTCQRHQVIMSFPKMKNEVLGIYN